MKRHFGKTTWLIIGSVMIIGGIGIVTDYQPAIEMQDSVTKADHPDDQGVIVPSQSQATFQTDESKFIQQMVAELRARHGHDINELTVQLTMQDFRDFVLEQFPQNGMEVFRQIMAQAFPNHVHDILEIVAKMDQYNQWHADNLLSLNEMNELARNGAIWNKRREIFGDLADIIWQNERNQEEAKRLAVQETVDALHQAKDLDMQERLQVLQSTIYEQFGDGNTNFLINKGMVANIYFHLDSVQDDLHGMSDSERAEAIAQARRQLGFTEADINYMAEQDAKKESRWKNGYAYMNERDQLSASYSGDTLEQKLDDLREKYFGREAPTIKKEEASGFNRYERPRMYGRN